jgi:phenylalanyl-tRNA synthetase beta chain
MKVPLNWLREFVDIPVSVDDLAHRLTMAGLEVASIRSIGLEGSELPWPADTVVIADVLEVRPHPNADRLVLADVNYGGSEPHVVVTGAPNLFPYKGEGPLATPLKSVFAREGARLYDGHQSGWVLTTLKARPVRGVMSDAMLCSEKELGMSEEHEGIILLDEDIAPGTPARDVLGDVVLDIDLTPNLARCLSIVGVAREVAAIFGVPLHIPEPQVHMEGSLIEERVRITVEEPHLCPRFTAGLVEGITIAPSPSWMQRRLSYAGMRPINNIVDISNYVMLEWGEPSHAFDADRVQEQHLITRLARPGERLVTLDGKERDLAPDNAPHKPPLLVCDPSGPLAIAGVMGGEASEVRETTTCVLLEAAIWEPRQIRRTAQAFKIPSEASRRYERGVDLEVAPTALRRALELMRTLAGGTVAQGIIDVYSEPWQPRTLELSPGEVSRIVGVHLSAHDIAGILGSLGFGCEVHNAHGMGDMIGYSLGMGLDPSFVRVQVPSYRQDVTMLADLCEEVSRIYGYNNIPTTRLSEAIPRPDAHPELDLEQRVRDTLIGCGVHDVITYSLTSLESVAKVAPSEAVASRYLRVSNSTSPEREYLQRSLLPTLLESLAANIRERERVLLFEIGRVFLPRSQPSAGAASEAWLPDEPRFLGLSIAGPRAARSWSAAGTEKGADPALLDYFDMKGVIEVLLARLGLRERVAFVPLPDDERFHPGRAAALLLERPAGPTDAISPDAQPQGGKKKGQRGNIEIISERVGVLGEIHPAARERLGIETERVAAAEIDLDRLFALAMPPAYRTISRYPATVQDLAVVVADDVPAEQVAARIQFGAGDLLESLTLFDLYTGPQVGEGHRSLAYRLTFRADDRTLSDEALAKVRTKIIKLLEREVGATIRG